MGTIINAPINIKVTELNPHSSRTMQVGLLVIVKNDVTKDKIFIPLTKDKKESTDDKYIYHNLVKNQETQKFEEMNMLKLLNLAPVQKITKKEISSDMSKLDLLEYFGKFIVKLYFRKPVNEYGLAIWPENQHKIQTIEFYTEYIDGKLHLVSAIPLLLGALAGSSNEKPATEVTDLKINSNNGTPRYPSDIF